MHFTLKENGHEVPMMGAYTTMPELNWAVISQRSLEKAREDAGVNELNKQALTFVLVVSFVALIFGYLVCGGDQRADPRSGTIHARHQPRRIP